jgi:hypothetical protein
VIVMPSNNSSMHLGWLAGRYPGRIGWLLSPGGWRRPHRWMPYALDNGAFPAWNNGKPWDEPAFVNMLRDAAGQLATKTLAWPPQWVIVPDVVADREATIARWHEWVPRLQPFGWPLAFAVQDGMTQADVPSDADVIFVGGSTEWKWRTMWEWARDNRRVHVGRVNGWQGLWDCHDAGVESCDGTGWFRGDQEQLAGLERYLDESTNGGRVQTRLCG